MKIKKIAAAVMAFAFAASMAVMPSSAGTLMALPGGGTKHYVLKVTGVFDVMEQTYQMGDKITGISTSMKPASGTASVGQITSNGKTFDVVKIEEPKLNNGSITSNSEMTFSVTTGNDLTTGGKVGSFTYTATFTLADDTKHPVNDLGMNVALSGFNYNASFSIPVYSGSGGASSPATITTARWKAEITETSTASTYTSGQVINSAAAFGNGVAMTLADCNAIRDASVFSVIVTLDKAATSDSDIMVFYTDLTTDSRPAVIKKGSNTVTIDVPKRFFFDSDSYDIYGGTRAWDYTFRSFRITNSGGYKYTSIAITFSGTAVVAPVNPGNNNSNNNANASNAITDDVFSELILNHTKITLNKGASFTLKAEDYNANELKFSTVGSSNGDIVSVYTSGKVKANKTGTATVRVRNSSGEAVECKVTIVNPGSKPASTFKLANSKGTVYKGSSYDLFKGATITTGYTDTVNWSSGDTGIATVSTSGKVKIVGTGIVTITATTSSGITQTCVLTARNPSLTLSASSANIKVGETVKISATAKPSSSKLTYDSLNESVATVSSTGIVKGVKAGTAKIEVTSNKGATKVFTVTVK